MFESCPFTYQNSYLDDPCDVCDFSSSSNLLSEDCEIAIADHCMVNYEHEPTACLEFWDLFIQPCAYYTLSVEEQEAFAKGITEGRDGKGIIFVFASGNEHGEGSNVNFDGIMSSRFTIVVGGTSKADGKSHC
jgi:kexin